LRNLIGDKQKREIISYAKENPKLTQQQIADNLTIKWDLLIKRRTVGDILNQKEFYESDNEIHRSNHMTFTCCAHTYL
jgi:ABC-type iron transport system FetAB ATPase subunit